MQLKNKTLKNIAFIASTVLLVLSARSSLADHVSVPTGSMLPTVKIGDRLFINKMAYGLRLPFTTWYPIQFEGPQRGDVVVLESPVDGEVLLKRVVAIEGDEVEVTHGRIIINGQLISLQRTNQGLREKLGQHEYSISWEYGGGPDLNKLRCPKDHYLVMGDNRGNSLDGRIFGLVERSSILGRALGVFWSEGSLQYNSL